LEVFLNMSMRFACFIDDFISGNKQNFRSWDYSPNVPDFQDSRIIRCPIKRNFAVCVQYAMVLFWIDIHVTLISKCHNSVFLYLFWN
jgi:hypothetical protein